MAQEARGDPPRDDVVLRGSSSFSADSTRRASGVSRREYRDRKQDFAKLAEACPALRAHLVPRPCGRKGETIDFEREESVEELTRCTLSHEFGVSWERPPHSLIPPVPNRYTYLLWLRDLLASTGHLGSSAPEARGVDVGTGGTLIYPLLGASAFGWRFLATECCAESLRWARRNLAANPRLGGLIEVRDSGGGYLAGVLDDGDGGGGAATYDFTMCNPPFFDEAEERTLHKPGHGGRANELRCPGGELAFASSLVDDSIVLGPRVTWYTTMVGRKRTLGALVSRLRGEDRVKEFRTTTFVCGRTTRWGLAWTLSSGELPICSLSLSIRAQIWAYSDPVGHVLVVSLSQFPWCRGLERWGAPAAKRRPRAARRRRGGGARPSGRRRGWRGSGERERKREGMRMCLPPWALAALAGKSDFPNPVVGGSERQGGESDVHYLYTYVQQ